MIVTGSNKLFGILSELCKWSDVNNRIIRKVQIIQCNPLLTQFAWVMHAKGKESLAITRWKTEYIYISIYVFIYVFKSFLLTFFFLDSSMFYWKSVYLILIWILIYRAKCHWLSHSLDIAEFVALLLWSLVLILHWMLQEW